MNTLNDELRYEQEMHERARELFMFNFNKNLEKGQVARTPVAKGIMKMLTETFFRNTLEWIKEELKPRRGVRPLHKDALENYAKVLGVDKLALTLCAVTMPSVLEGLISISFTSLSHISLVIGNHIQDTIAFEAFAKEFPEITPHVTEEYKKRVDGYKKAYYLRNKYQKENFKFYQPSTKTKIALGFILVNILVKSTNLIEIDTQNGKSSVLRPTELFLQIWDTNLTHLCHSLRLRVPTIIPPKPWESLTNGAYYGNFGKPTAFIRQPYIIRKTRLFKDYLRKLKELDLSEILQAVNKIQSTPYQINKEVLAVVQTIIQNGGGQVGIPSLEPEPEIAILGGNPSKEELKNHKQKYVDRIYREQKRKSKALVCLNTVSMAELLEKYNTIYFPCNIDFRGRVYPISLFNHQGDDLMKSLILYQNPKPTTREDDWDLLCIQGCNLYGNDKISLADRVKFIEDNSQNILASAHAPFDSTFWKTADDPLQFLAFCFEYKKALDYRKQQNTFIGYKCGIVIAYDGTCSGLQHYSAMLQDPIGGSAVNLVDHATPSDIYQKVADKVLPMVEKDTREGSPDTTREDGTTKAGTKTVAEAWLSYGITRKVCKRPVMTLAYGSGQYGFKSQLYEDICKDNPLFKGMETYASAYLAKYIWEAVQTVVVSATEGMRYLKALAGVLTKHDLPVNWWTPLGFPVQQQYLKTSLISFRTRLGDKMSMPLYYDEIDRNEHVKKSKQKNGVAPNFIHSLDATHLMMVVNNANCTNYTTIHDSFGTSLGEAHQLKEVIRQQLYRLYTVFKPLESFRDYVASVTGDDLSDITPPTKGDLDLRQILTSKYVFH